MSKISREDNKKRFKTGMYPTQQDFENVFDSYVHKDDTIDPSKIVSGDENIVDIINRKAEERHNHPISEVDNLSETLQQIQDDLDTAEDNIAGHETRIVTLEAAKTDYEAFKERVRAFLEDANTSDTTIDSWHEIENFLQGITDTETLTGLLNDLKQEILGSIPEPQTGNYLELVDDLDAYTDAPDGKIVKYVGQTNEKYTRGFDYERVKKETVIPAGAYYFDIQSPIIMEDLVIPVGKYQQIVAQPRPILTEYVVSNTHTSVIGVQLELIRPGDVVYSFGLGDKYFTVTDIEGESIHISDGENEYTITNGQQYSSYKGSFAYQDYRIHASTFLYHIVEKQGHYYVRNADRYIENAEKTTIDIVTTDNSWQPIPSFNVIN